MDPTRAVVRTKRRESKQQSKQQLRIDHPLVSYTENDQPFCKVCKIPLKSEALWDAHRRSLKHHENEQKFKAGAAVDNTGAQNRFEKKNSSSLPSDFFELERPKRQRTGTDFEESSYLTNTASASKNKDTMNQSEVANPVKENEITDGLVENQDVAGYKLHHSTGTGVQTSMKSSLEGTLPSNFFDDQSERFPTKESKKMPVTADLAKGKQALPEGFFESENTSNTLPANQLRQLSVANGVDPKQHKGALPEGFFDNKDADLRARGIQPVKVDKEDAYKEFEKDIQEDLHGVDDRLEEEEVDAAIEREQYMTLEQREYREKVDMVKKKILETKAARIARAKLKPPVILGNEIGDDSSDDDVAAAAPDAVDWRAQHL